ncbi:MAG: hypothetical protein EOM52_02505 [Clostridia bacterium]|nr:hypothetical protein [Clostridia bacterium]
MSLPFPIIFLLALLALAGCVLLFIRSTRRMRDRVFPPKETVLGTGLRSALLIYQPSRHNQGARIAKAVAGALVNEGYTVRINRPSPALSYDPDNFSYLIFGGTAYMDDVGKPLLDYLTSLKFKGKRILLYSIGDSDKAPELAGLRLCVPTGNAVRTIKVRADELNKLCMFAAYE